MGQKSKNHSQEFKAKVALEAVRGVHAQSELASRYKAHSTQIAQWEKQLLENAASCFVCGCTWNGSTYGQAMRRPSMSNTEIGGGVQSGDANLIRV